ncbi:putative elicitor-responsive protein 3 [Cocos nucifera]|uniref:Putative elicitor-responsive protein 3 n=1 Tax=Cocos nucifera TaxID=13894 RepID=A0A8K0IN15_COCNU|nr:putative elicitor-responsive protein 3 [Cocos nucifera]
MSIQGQLLEVTVIGCSKLKDTEWMSQQDPFVCLEYATTKFRTRTCTDGGKNPCFQEKTMIPLVEGLREVSVSVWNSNTITYDDFIGGGRVQLQKVLSQGYDDSSWSLQSKSGKYAGEVKLIMHYANASKAQVIPISSQTELTLQQPLTRQHIHPHHVHHQLILLLISQRHTLLLLQCHQHIHPVKHTHQPFTPLHHKPNCVIHQHLTEGSIHHHHIDERRNAVATESSVLPAQLVQCLILK